MKKRIRPFALLSALLLMLAACSDGTSPPPTPTAGSDAEKISTILEIYSMEDRFDRMEKLIPVLRGLTAGEADLIGEFLNSVDLAYREDARILIVTAWSKHDPAAATKWAMRREFVEFARTIMFDEATYRWALEDPEAIVGDMDVAIYSKRGWDPAMIRALVRGWADSGKPRLEQYIFDLGRMGDDRQRALGELIKVRLRRDGPDAMIAWARDLSGDDAFREFAQNRLAGDIARIDPARAVAWCDEVCGSSFGESMVPWIAAEWAEKHGADAMDWIIARPNSIPSRIGARSAYRRFLLNEPDEAIAWMEATTEEQRSSPVIAGPIEMFVTQRSALKMYDVAIKWASYLEDERQRNQALVSNVRRWLRYDEAAAEAWLAESSIPERVKPYVYQKGMIPNSVYKTE